MGLSVHWSWLAVLSCLLCMGGEVRCDCTESRMEIEGGHYTMTNGLKVASMLIYHCPEGYYPYPHLSRVCQLNGSWKPAPKRIRSLRQKCRLVECPDPNVLESHGEVNPPQERYYVHNVTTYECYSGYTMRGPSKRVCLPNGKWSGPTPICGSASPGDNCPDPGTPAGSTRSGNIFGIGDTVTYTCNGNLFLVGSSERVCQENTQWTGIEPACYYKHTYDTPLEVSQAFGSAIKDSLTTLEPVDDTQEGRKIRISKNGTLNIYVAVDISASITEEQVQNAKDAVSQLITKISSFSVTPNYDIIFFSSQPFEVVNILDFLERKIELPEVKAKLDDFEIGDRNAGTDLKSVFKRFEERMAIIKQRVGEEGFKEHRHVIMLFTDGAYNMGGSPAPTVATIKKMIYMNQTKEDGAPLREDYLDIYVFAIGSDIFDDDLKPLTAGTGPHYFRMKDIENLQETFDLIIDEAEVVGLCGLHKEYETTEENKGESKRRMYPWWASITVKNGVLPMNCLGSLVTPQFVLTAAHCFKFGDLPEHVTVEIDDRSDKGSQDRSHIKTVKTFKLHPKYNTTSKRNEGVVEFYDYDVALIQLEEDVKISDAVRPICLPCTKATSAALKLVGDSTCERQEKMLFTADHEKVSFLTKKGTTVLEKNAIAKLGSQRDHCIKHALEAPGINTKDPKDAVTENFFCTGGVEPQRDHISCKGDSGGAVFKNYEHRTIQVALVSWGTKDLCKKGGGVVESDKTSRDFHINLFKVVPFLKSILGNDTDEYAPLEFLD